MSPQFVHIVHERAVFAVAVKPVAQGAHKLSVVVLPIIDRKEPAGQTPKVVHMGAFCVLLKVPGAHAVQTGIEPPVVTK